MKYQIEGANRESGDEVAVTIDAANEGDARSTASRMGIVVAACRPAVQAASPTQRLVVFITMGVVAVAAAAIVAAVVLRKNGARQAGQGRTDLTVHPEVLLDRSVSRADYMLNGVKLGDPESRIDKEQVISRNDYGWVECKDGNMYRVELGRVVGLSLRDPSAVARLNFTQPEAVISAFGKPDRRSKDHVTGEPDDFYFNEGTLLVLWSPSGVTGVNVYSESPFVDDLRRYVRSCEPFVAQVKGLQARVESGLSFRQFDQKMQEVIDARGQMGKPPEGHELGEQFARECERALESYRDALQAWSNAINEPLVAFSAEPRRDEAMQRAAQEVRILAASYETLKAKAEN